MDQATLLYGAVLVVVYVAVALLFPEPVQNAGSGWFIQAALALWVAGLLLFAATLIQLA